MDDVPVPVAKELDLYVAGGLEVTLKEHGVVAERSCGFAASAGYSLGQIGLAAHDAHALASTAARRLHQQRVAHLTRPLAVLVACLAHYFDGWQSGNSRLRHQPLGCKLVAHRGDGLRP